MRIALCLEYPVDQHGGTEVLVRKLVKGLAARHEIILVSPDAEQKLPGLEIGRLIRGHIRLEPERDSIAAAKKLARQIAEAKVDIAHFHGGGNYGWSARNFLHSTVVHAARLGVPCISTNHGAFSITEGYCGEHRKFLKLALFLPAWLSKQVVLAHLRCEVAVSQNDFHNLRRWYPPLRKKFRWIYHSRLHGTPPPENPARRKTILCAGTIGPRKGQPLLVEAFARVAKKFPDWQLVFIGRGGDEESLNRIHEIIGREKIENQVQLLGARNDDELRCWLQQSAIFAMPSLYEGLGLSLQEAQFYGCACVATRCGGTADLIEDGENGFLVPVDRPAPMADALEKLMGDERLRGRFGGRAPQSVLEKNMTADKMVAAYENLYMETGGHNSRGPIK